MYEQDHVIMVVARLGELYGHDHRRSAWGGAENVGAGRRTRGDGTAEKGTD